MARKKTRTKTGRPRTTGSGVPMFVRMHSSQIKRLDRWISDSNISRPEAIRQLLDWALDQTLPAATPEDTPVHVVRRARESSLRRT